MTSVRAAALATLAPGLALACSGPGAAEAIVRNELLGLLGLVGSLWLVVVGAVRRRRRGRGWLSASAGVLVLLLNPFFFVSSRGGDCGQTLLVAAAVFVLFAVTWAAWPMKARVE